MESYQQTISPVFHAVIDVIYDVEQRCEEEIDILREVAPPQEELYIERLEDVAYRLYETTLRVFARRIFLNLSHALEPSVYIPVEWAVNMGAQSLESIQKQLRQDVQNVIEHAMEDYMTEAAAVFFNKCALSTECIF